MKSRKKIYLWGPDLRKSKYGTYSWLVEVLRDPVKKGEEIDKGWVEFRRVKRKKKR